MKNIFQAAQFVNRSDNVEDLQKAFNLLKSKGFTLMASSHGQIKMIDSAAVLTQYAKEIKSFSNARAGRVFEAMRSDYSINGSAVKYINEGNGEESEEQALRKAFSLLNDKNIYIVSSVFDHIKIINSADALVNEVINTPRCFKAPLSRL